MNKEYFTRVRKRVILRAKSILEGIKVYYSIIPLELKRLLLFIVIPLIILLFMFPPTYELKGLDEISRVYTASTHGIGAIQQIFQIPQNNWYKFCLYDNLTFRSLDNRTLFNKSLVTTKYNITNGDMIFNFEVNETTQSYCTSLKLEDNFKIEPLVENIIIVDSNGRGNSIMQINPMSIKGTLVPERSTIFLVIFLVFMGGNTLILVIIEIIRFVMYGLNS